MMKNDARRGVLVSLDDIFDTRLATLGKYWPEVAQASLESGHYHNRLSDVWPGVSLEDFRTRYKARDATILKDAYFTPILLFIREAISGFMIELTYEQFRNTPKLYINTWPYISDKQWEEEFKSVLYPMIGDPRLFEIRFIHRSPEQLDTTWVNEFITLYFNYSGWEWVEAQSTRGQFEKRICPEVRFFIPRLDDTGQHTPETLEHFIQDSGLNPFDVVRESIRPMIDLTYLEVRHFSIVDPADLLARLEKASQLETEPLTEGPLAL